MVENGKNLDEDVNTDGLAEIDDGVIRVTNPRGQGKAVLLIPAEGADVTVNGETMSGKQYVYTEDKIKVNLMEEIIPPRIEINISRDGMTAEAKVTPEMKITHELLDQPSLNILKIATARIETVTRGITREEIMEALEEEQVIFGIDMDIVLELSEAWETITRTVARGDPMEAGKDGYVEYLVKTEKELVSYKGNEAKVDYRERYNIPQVNEGDVLATIHPPEEGIPGRKVTGEEIQPPPVKEAVVNCKEGAALSADRAQVIATSKGRPIVKKGREDLVYIEKFYVHYNDVNMESGNVKFQGHLKVEGSVEEGMTVFADGDIVVTRNTAGARIIGGGNVNIFGNCINCQVRAGGLQLLCQELSEILEFIRVSLEIAVENLDQVTAALKQRGDFPQEKYPYVLNTLLKSKFPEVNEFMERIRKLLVEKKEFLPPSNAMERIDELVSFFLDGGWEQAKNEKYLKKMYRLVDETLIIILAIAEAESDINVQYVQNSKLECTGSIAVEGAGAYNSSFICGGKVVIKRVFRGGNIEAGGDVVIGELGSPGTSVSHGLVHVPENNSIKLGKVHEGSRIRIGERIYRLDSTYSNIKVYLDIPEDKVRVTYWR